MAKLSVHVALDLGSDTTKVVYAYHDGNDYTGKLVGDPLGMTAIPSVAYYDTDEKKWLFGDEVDNVCDKPLLTVVKICDLLRLLQPADSAAAQKKNRNYYFKQTKFPKFYFPQRDVFTEDMDEAVRLDRTFTAGETPSEVCERFFDYIYGIVVDRLNVLLGAKGHTLNIMPGLVYPAFSNAEYIGELERLVARAFGTKPKTVLSMAKALCAYAKHSDRIDSNDKTIIFNIGEERISLVKVAFSHGGISMDGEDGHNTPADIGGKDIDDAVADYIEAQMSGRETMGRPSSGEDGHISESALYAKQYLFVKDIKSAKIVLGMPIYNSKAFKNGVPISASRDLLVQRYITRDEFAQCVGITSGDGVAQKFVDYIKEELERSINSDIKKIYITGGPVETYGLVEYIRKQIKPLGVDVLTFEKDDSEYVGVENDGFNIMSHEDALYAPALGCAMASLYNMNIDMVLALTYGIRLYRDNGGKSLIPFFKVLVEKGTRIPKGGATFCTPKDTDKSGLTTGDDSDESAPMHIMSTFFSSADIEHSRKAPAVSYIKSNGENLLVVNTDDQKQLKKLQKEIGLRVLNGSIDSMGDGSRARYYHNGRRIKIVREIYLQLGVEIDGDGRARAFARNDERRNGTGYTDVVYLNGSGGRPKNIDPFDKYGSSSGGERKSVPKSSIEFRFSIETQLT